MNYEWIKQRRAVLGMTQGELADRMQVSQTTVSGWERGSRAPSDDQWTQLNELLGDGSPAAPPAAPPPVTPAPAIPAAKPAVAATPTPAKPPVTEAPSAVAPVAPSAAPMPSAVVPATPTIPAAVPQAAPVIPAKAPEKAPNTVFHVALEQAAAEVRTLVDQIGKSERWETSPVAEEMRTVLLKHRAELVDRLAAQLVTIRRLGGTLAVEGAPAILQLPPSLAAPEGPVRTVTVAVPPTRDVAPVLRAWREEIPERHLGSASWLDDDRRDWRPQLVALLASLQPGRDDLNDLERIVSVVANCQEFVRLPSEVQRSLIGHLAARLRSIQERGLRDRRLDQSFLTLTAYTARERPGFVMGLNRNHRPSRRSWSEDADSYWDRLLACLPADPVSEEIREQILATLTKTVAEHDALAADKRAPLAARVVRETRTAVESGISAREVRLVKLATPFLASLTGAEFRLLRRSIKGELDIDDPQPDGEANSGSVPTNIEVEPASTASDSTSA